MGVPAKTKAQIIEDMRDAVNAVSEEFDVSDGSPITDVALNPVAEVLYQAYLTIAETEDKHSFLNEPDLTSDEVQELAESWGLTRLDAVKGTGTVWFRTGSEPTEDITVGALVRVATQSDPENSVAAVVFETLEAKVLPYSQRSSYYNTTDAVWEIEVRVQASQAGTGGNVRASKIVVMVDSVTGIDSVTNKQATSGGTEEETKAALAQRAIASYAGGDFSTAPSIKRQILGFSSNVVDCEVIRPGDSEMVRNGLLGNAVDAYVEGQELAPATDVATFSASSPDIVLEQQPVSSITSINGLSGTTSTVYVEGVDFDLVRDTQELGGSRNGSDLIRWISGHEPADSDVLTILYYYNYLIKRLQDYFSQETNNIINLDFLIKEGTIAYIVMAAQVLVATGQTAATVLAQIQADIISFINGKSFGDSITQGDIIARMENALTDGSISIDHVILPLTELRRNTEASGVMDDITLTRREYAVVESVTISE